MDNQSVVEASGGPSDTPATNGGNLPERPKQSKPKKEKPPKPKKDPSSTQNAPKSKVKPDNNAKNLPIDPDAMFKVGFLADVYNERPEKHVVTRCTPP